MISNDMLDEVTKELDPLHLTTTFPKFLFKLDRMF